jgi:hypothetical protein
MENGFSPTSMGLTIMHWLLKLQLCFTLKVLDVFGEAIFFCD